MLFATQYLVAQLLPIATIFANVTLDGAFERHDVVATVLVTEAILQEVPSSGSGQRACHINVVARIVEGFKGTRADVIRFSTPSDDPIAVGAQYVTFLRLDNALWFPGADEPLYSTTRSATNPDDQPHLACAAKALPLKGESFPQRLLRLDYDFEKEEDWVEVRLNNIVFPDDIPVRLMDAARVGIAQADAKKIQYAALRRHLQRLSKSARK